VIERMVGRAFPRGRVTELQPLEGGYRNGTFKLRVDAASEPLVLRVYRHDTSLCQKELDLLELVRSAVPVPEVVYAAATGFEELPPFALMRFVEGVTLHELAAHELAAFSAGEVLAAIGGFTFSAPGWLAPGPTVAGPLLEGAHPMPRFVDQCLASVQLQQRVPTEVRDAVHKLVWTRSGELAEWGGEARLVHGDFNAKNLIVRCEGGRWNVAAVLDWEFAVSGSPLADIGNFLRFGDSPDFVAGYAHGGGVLPPDGRRLARLIDLVAVCDLLTRDTLPEEEGMRLADVVNRTARLE
jgi:aminoglycoside phosphotransferase (APT) family kinase protein